jgi:V/A-type H+-transporting ATPase subunit I
MKKITVLVSRPDIGPLAGQNVEKCIKRLGAIGVLHLRHVNPPAGAAIDKLREKADTLRAAEKIFEAAGHFEPASDALKVSAPPASRPDAYALARRTLDLEKQRLAVVEEIGKLQAQRRDLDVWGRVDTGAIDQLKTAGVEVRLCECTQKALDAIPEGTAWAEVSRRGKNRYIAVFSHKKAAVGDGALEPERIREGMREIPMPAHGSDEILAMADAAEARLAAIDGEFFTLRGRFGEIRAEISLTLDALGFEEALAGAGKKDGVSYVTGFCPAGDVLAIQEAAVQDGWAVLVEDPAADDPVPTLLKRPALTRIIGPLMDFLGIVPGYREYDTGGIFLVFFSVFFAIIIGDAGYGAVLAAAACMLERHGVIDQRRARLLYTLGAATVLWGAATGMWFGVEAIGRLPGFRRLIIPSLHAYAKESDEAVIRLCLALGAVQLSLAHAWRAARLAPSLRSLGEAGWAVFMWSVYFSVGYLILGEEIHRWQVYVSACGAGLILLFGGGGEGGALRGVAMSIVKFPLNALHALGGFSDLVSYIRLFAVGLAAKEVAVAFNGMAMQVGFDSAGHIFISVLILALGHGINVMLGAISVLVHGVRLNVLEFSRHLDLQWSGAAYRPFKLGHTAFMADAVMEEAAQKA